MVTLADIQLAFSTAILEAEERCKHRCEAPDPYHIPNTGRFNTDYWARVGPAINALRASWRQADALAALEREVQEIEEKYTKMAECLPAQ